MSIWWYALSGEDVCSDYRDGRGWLRKHSTFSLQALWDNCPRPWWQLALARALELPERDIIRGLHAVAIAARDVLPFEAEASYRAIRYVERWLNGEGITGEQFAAMSAAAWDETHSVGGRAAKPAAELAAQTGYYLREGSLHSPQTVIYTAYNAVCETIDREIHSDEILAAPTRGFCVGFSCWNYNCDRCRRSERKQRKVAPRLAAAFAKAVPLPA